jgi:ElaB/YqjD/DUF883 family membrane-anchored ribosome-binding protein
VSREETRVPTTNNQLVPDRPVSERDDSLALARADVFRSLDRLRHSVAELRHEVAVRADWRTYVRARPWLFLGGAFLLGVFLGSRGSHDTPNSRPKRRL